MKYSVLIILSVILLSSCAKLAIYERVYVNDPEMQIADDSGQSFQT